MQNPDSVAGTYVVNGNSATLTANGNSLVATTTDGWLHFTMSSETPNGPVPVTFTRQ